MSKIPRWTGMMVMVWSLACLWVAGCSPVATPPGSEDMATPEQGTEIQMQEQAHDTGTGSESAEKEGTSQDMAPDPVSDAATFQETGAEQVPDAATSQEMLAEQVSDAATFPDHTSEGNPTESAEKPGHPETTQEQIGTEPSGESEGFVQDVGAADAGGQEKEPTCQTHCDCHQGLMCVVQGGTGTCIAATKPVWCCDKAGCPSGSACTDSSGHAGTCPQAATDCEQKGGYCSIQGKACQTGYQVSSESCGPILSRMCCMPTTGGCKVDCDCTQGLLCASGKCIAGFAPAWCCDKSGCPQGQRCTDLQGNAGVCP